MSIVGSSLGVHISLAESSGQAAYETCGLSIHQAVHGLSFLMFLALAETEPPRALDLS
jgi:hypothetical protein